MITHIIKARHFHGPALFRSLVAKISAFWASPAPALIIAVRQRLYRYVRLPSLISIWCGGRVSTGSSWLPASYVEDGIKIVVAAGSATADNSGKY